MKDELRLLAAKIAEWRSERGNLTQKVQKIASVSFSVMLAKGIDPTKEIAELNKKIGVGNATAEGLKERIRDILLGMIAEIGTAAETASRDAVAIRREAANGLQQFLRNFAELGQIENAQNKRISEFNALVADLTKTVVETGDANLPKVGLNLSPPSRPGWDFGQIRNGKIDEALVGMLRVLDAS